MSDQTLIAIVAIACVFVVPGLIAAVTIITGHQRQVKVDEANAALKREMIDRGFSADEIVRVINAGSGEMEEKEAEAK